MTGETFSPFVFLEKHSFFKHYLNAEKRNIKKCEGAFQMLNSRKNTIKVFSKLTDLPKEIVEHYRHKESGDVIIFSPLERYRDGKGKYFCTKCGTKGETNEDNPVCSHCGNTAFRPPLSDGRYTDSCRNVHYVQQVDEYGVIREFDCYPKEFVEDSVTT